MVHVLSSPLAMDEERKDRPQGPTLYIDENERVNIIRRMAEMVPPKKKADLARDCDVTPSAITLLLKRPIPKGKTRGCKFLGALQDSLGLANTTKKRPVVIDKAASRRAERILHALAAVEDDEALENWLKNGEILATKR